MERQNMQKNQKKRMPMIYGAVTILVFFLCARFIQFPFVQENPILQNIYARLSQLCALCVMAIFLLSFKTVPKALYFSMAGMYAMLLLATLFHGGSVYRLISSAYPVLALNAYVILQCRTMAGAKHFVKTLANTFLVLAGVNLLMMLFAPNAFGVTETTNGAIYLMGMENQLGYPLVAGLMLVLLNDCLAGEKWKVQFYAVIYCTTTILNFSVGSLMGALVLLLYLVLPTKWRLFEKTNFLVFVGAIAVVFVVLVIFHEPVLNCAPIKFVLENILHKDTTLTHRTTIWDLAMKGIAESPITGHGVANTVNLFTIQVWGKDRTLSAHNQYVQTWYEGGILSLIALIIFLGFCGIILSRASDSRLACFVKLIATCLMLMLMTEAPGFDCLLFVVMLGSSVVLCMEEQQKKLRRSNSVPVPEEDLISVVVPVYNVESYLEECFSSIARQTYRNLEIIVINDGSTDNSYGLCKAFAEQDERVVLIDQKNQGLSGARNTGIQVARGKYITFVDSDDVLDPDMIGYLYRLIRHRKADMSVCQKELVDEQTTRIPSWDVCVDKVYKGKTRCMEALLRDAGVGVYAWGKLYKTSMFEHVRYPVGKYHEDVFTTHQLMDSCSKLAVGSERLYLYRQRGGSIMHAAFSPKHLHAVEGNEAQAQFISARYPKLKRISESSILWAANSCVMRLMHSEQVDADAVAYLQTRYRKYEWSFLLGNSNMRAKLFSLAAFVNLNGLLKMMAAVREWCGRIRNRTWEEA